jgi:hypothetical protein
MSRIPLSRTGCRADDTDSLVELVAANRRRFGDHDDHTPTDALAQADNYVACMHSHGVSDFSEPTVVNSQITFAGPSGLGRTPAFLSAQQTCGQSIYGTSPVQGGGGG